ncbi:hypothetical protein [Acinetobacter sp. YH12086]|uniref:hypothetical protein n=1 Tax=Acinetobacter sp. YH12086 TaxID=2601078 RepID=UPI0015D38423|nr:hypothetical protein [Acinetobacter sp. YH12086]
MFNIEMQVGAKFKIAVKKHNKVIKETGWSDNIVLDSGLSRMSVGRWIDRCCVGTGNSTPLASQTMLDNFVAASTTAKGSSAVANTAAQPYYYGQRIVWGFSVGSATGNISEVGLGWGNYDLWNRALIRDIAGNPTTITVLSDEVLEVTSEVRCYPASSISGGFQLVDKNDNLISSHSYVGLPTIANASVFITDKITLGYSGGNSVLYTASASNVAMPTGLTTIPVMYGDNAADANNTTYPTTTSAKAICTFPPSRANFDHRFIFLRNNLLANMGIGYKLEITPPIPKTNTESLTYEFVMSWGRYESS